MVNEAQESEKAADPYASRLLPCPSGSAASHLHNACNFMKYTNICTTTLKKTISIFKWEQT